MEMIDFISNHSDQISNRGEIILSVVVNLLRLDKSIFTNRVWKGFPQFPSIT